ncbi:hypothetical protein CPC08DRAFT_703801 [Agrocybe pediades]|nr:hypothetical protein CPC08DRAFT_703801 [Agrocybe pediades]
MIPPDQLDAHIHFRASCLLRLVHFLFFELFGYDIVISIIPLHPIKLRPTHGHCDRGTTFYDLLL